MILHLPSLKGIFQSTDHLTMMV